MSNVFKANLTEPLRSFSIDDLGDFWNFSFTCHQPHNKSVWVGSPVSLHATEGMASRAWWFVLDKTLGNRCVNPPVPPVGTPQLIGLANSRTQPSSPIS